MPEGRQHYIDEDGEYLLIPCDICGAQAVHDDCLPEGHDFICNDCELVQPSKKRKSSNDESVNFINQIFDIDKNNNIATPSQLKFVRSKITLILPNRMEENHSENSLTSGKRKSIF